MKTEYTLWSAVEGILAASRTQKQAREILAHLAKACRTAAEYSEEKGVCGFTCQLVSGVLEENGLLYTPYVRGSSGPTHIVDLYGLVMRPESSAGEALDLDRYWIRDFKRYARSLACKNWLTVNVPFEDRYHTRLMLMYFAAEFFDDLAKTYKHPKKGTQHAR